MIFTFVHCLIFIEKNDVVIKEITNKKKYKMLKYIKYINVQINYQKQTSKEFVLYVYHIYFTKDHIY